MDGWNYFKALSLVYGILLVSIAPLKGFFPATSTGSEEASARPRTRAVLRGLVGTLGILLILLTWSMHATHPVSYSWVVTLIVTITGYQFVRALFRSGRSRVGTESHGMKGRRSPARTNLILGALGVLLVLLGVFVY